MCRWLLLACFRLLLTIDIKVNIITLAINRSLTTNASIVVNQRGIKILQCGPMTWNYTPCRMMSINFFASGVDTAIKKSVIISCTADSTVTAERVCVHNQTVISYKNRGNTPT